MVTGAGSALGEAEIDELQTLLDGVPPPLEPLDASMLDGFLCGVLVQPQRIEEREWLRCVCDADGRPPPPGFDTSRLYALARLRHRELDASIAARRWFDPWVFELADTAPPDTAVGDDETAGDASRPAEAVHPWIAGFAAALDRFPVLMRQDAERLRPALVLLYRHLDPDDLEDAEDLLDEIDTLEPPADLGVAVEELVRATLLLADVSRPVRPARAFAPRRRH